MEDYFDINFQVDGVLYEGQAWPAVENFDAYFQVTYHPSDHPEEHRIVFLDVAPDLLDSRKLKWIQKPGTDEKNIMSKELILAISSAIEAHEKQSRAYSGR